MAIRAALNDDYGRSPALGRAQAYWHVGEFQRALDGLTALSTSTKLNEPQWEATVLNAQACSMPNWDAWPTRARISRRMAVWRRLHDQKASA